MKILVLSILVLITFSCQTESELQTYGKQFQNNKDYKSLKKVVELIPLQSDKSLVKEILGEPIDFGFDYRYLIDSTGQNGCTIGAVFHLDENGKIDDKWIDEICE